MAKAREGDRFEVIVPFYQSGRGAVVAVVVDDQFVFRGEVDRSRAAVLLAVPAEGLSGPAEARGVGIQGDPPSSSTSCKSRIPGAGAAIGRDQAPPAEARCLDPQASAAAAPTTAIARRARGSVGRQLSIEGEALTRDQVDRPAACAAARLLGVARPAPAAKCGRRED